jgi:hypothetical protein
MAQLKFGPPVQQCNMHRFHLESRFPRLAFHFFSDVETYPDKVTVRIFIRDANGSYHAATGTYHDEAVDPETFPDDLFYTKCMLVGG